MRIAQSHGSLRVPHRRRAVTLLELLVAIGGMVVIAGTALGIYEQTQTASVKMIARQGAEDFALRIIGQLQAALSAAIPPSDLDGIPALAGKVQFKADGFSVPVLFDPKTPPAFLAGGLKLSCEAIQTGAPGAALNVVTCSAPGGVVAGLPESASAGSNLQRYKASLTLRYADTARPGEGPAYVGELPAGKWPAIVEIKVRVDLAAYQVEPIVFQTAVIPGGVLAAVAPEGAKP